MVGDLEQLVERQEEKYRWGCLEYEQQKVDTPCQGNMCMPGKGGMATPSQGMQHCITEPTLLDRRSI